MYDGRRITTARPGCRPFCGTTRRRQRPAAAAGGKAAAAGGGEAAAGLCPGCAPRLLRASLRSQRRV